MQPARLRAGFEQVPALADKGASQSISDIRERKIDLEFLGIVGSVGDHTGQEPVEIACNSRGDRHLRIRYEQLRQANHVVSMLSNIL